MIYTSGRPFIKMVRAWVKKGGHRCTIHDVKYAPKFYVLIPSATDTHPILILPLSQP